jgi:glutamate/tyrosine decarboxylase-like PLP-dependent enzyme
LASAIGRCAVDLAALEAAIAADRAEGYQPACVIATAGTVNTGAIDDLEALAALAKREDLWLHVDGAIGALLAIAPKNAWRVEGLMKADSIALDPHKWLHAPFEAGCVLVKDAARTETHSPFTRNISSRRHAGPPRANGCTTMGSRQAVVFARSRSGWR